MLRAFPSYQTLDSPFVQSTWDAAKVKVDNPAADMSRRFPPGSHESNVNFRVLVPLVAHAFKLGRPGILLFAAGAGIALLWFVYGSVEATGGGSRAAYLACFVVACAWPGQSAFHELRGGYYDAFAFALVACAFTSAPAMTFCLLLAAEFCDERVFFSGSFLIVRAAVHEPGFRSVARAAVPVVASAACYAILRAAMSLYWSYPFGVTGGVGLQVFDSQRDVVPMALWSGLSGGWIAVACGLVFLFAQRAYVAASLFACLLAVCVLSSFLVFDTTRSLAYCFPAVLVSMAGFARYGATRLAVRVLTLSALACLATTPIYVEGRGVWKLHSLPSQLADWNFPLASRS